MQRDTSQALLPEGLNELLQASVSLHEVMANRLRAVPETVQQALGLASLQGNEFVVRIVKEQAQRLGAILGGNEIELAQSPHRLVTVLSDVVGEFTQQIVRDIAVDRVSDFFDPSAALAVLQDQARSSMSEETLAGRDSEEACAINALAASLFEASSNRDDLVIACRARWRLIGLALRRFDYGFAAAGIAGLSPPSTADCHQISQPGNLSASR